MDRSVLKTGIPAFVVASVLGFSLLFPAAASRDKGHGDDKHGYGEKCGYGQVQDTDENDNDKHGGGGDRTGIQLQPAAPLAVTQAEKDKEKKNHDNDCNEDEGDNGDDGGGGGNGGGDRAVVNTNQGTIATVTTLRRPFRNPTVR